jgi:anti-sigma regulatory factor (Ser/Thr protein kinase)
MTAVTAVRPTGSWGGDTFAHEAFLFATDEDVVARVLPFVREGLAREEPVLVVAGERVRRVVADELGDDLPRLAAFAPAEDWWRGGHGTLLAYDGDLRALRRASRCWRLAAEPVWLAAQDGRVWSRFEAVANRCYADMPYYSLCLHDTTRLAPEVLDAVGRTHPLVWDGSSPVASPTYQEPEAFVSAAEPPWEPRPVGVQSATVTTGRDARDWLTSQIGDEWRDRLDDVLLAVHELVANALREAGAAYVAAWSTGEELVCEVSDPGAGMHDVTAGYVPPGPECPGRGLWLARSLADDAAVAPAGPGTRIRLYFRR